MKELLNILKMSRQENTVMYHSLQTRLGHLYMLNNQDAESELYLRAVADGLPLATANTINYFIAEKNLFALYTQTNLEKARVQASLLTQNMDEYCAHDRCDINFLHANLLTLEKKNADAIPLYKEVLDCEEWGPDDFKA